MKLRSYLLQVDISQADFGQIVGLSQAQVSRIVNGASPPPDLAIRISRATDGRVLIADLIPSVFEAVREEIARTQPEVAAIALAAEPERSAVS